MSFVIFLVIGIVVLTAITAWLSVRLRTAIAARAEAESDRDQLLRTYRPILDAEAERARIFDEIGRARDAAAAELEQRRMNAERAFSEMQQRYETSAAELLTTQARLQQLRTELAALDEEANLESFAFYKPLYSFADSRSYAERLDAIRDGQKLMLKQKVAASCPVEWSVNGSKVEGRKQINQTLKLMLRAFNGECDAAISKVRYNNVHVMEARIRKAFEGINGLAEVQQCAIAEKYLSLKIDELSLVYSYEEKLQDEKEEQRRYREQLRDEEIALRQIEKAKAEAERDESRYAEALEEARAKVEAAEGAKQAKLLGQIEELERRLQEAHENKERAISRAQLTKSGHVYVISNIGSFGEHVYKIGMTRRLDPLERIDELGDASVPFDFDIHAVVFSEDAPALECELHRAFCDRRINRVNQRKEFFKATIDEIAAAVVARCGGQNVSIKRLAPAEEYRKTQAILEEERQGVRLPIAAAAPGVIGGDAGFPMTDIRLSTAANRLS